MKKIICLAFSLLLVCVLSLSVYAESVSYLTGTNSSFNIPDSGGAFVDDDADLLTDSEEEQLIYLIGKVRNIYNFDIVIHTTNDFGSDNADDVVAYADDYYDYNNYADDGIAFVVSMKNRDFCTSTKGYGITAFTDYGLSELDGEIATFLGDGDYYDGFVRYIDKADNYLEMAKNGEPYDIKGGNDSSSSEPKGVGDYLKNELILIVVAFVIAFVVGSSMKAKMNTARAKKTAADYMKPGSLNIVNGNEVFLYSNVSKTPIPKNTSSSGGSGGSSVHTSSSGSSHGGSHGKF